ncbi:hypothetical protein C8J56DRAFT_969108 [Mycena floridula]|nr:hypothetical protein C8J56DRAFT_969108 [Mycena floridula]
MLSRRVLSLSLFAKTPRARALYSSHSSDTYSKDVDSNPPKDPKIHQVDPVGAKARSNATPPSDDPKTEGYETAQARSEPYKAPGPKERYGAMGGTPGDGDATSKPDEGPQGKESGGRKPEGQ